MAQSHPGAWPEWGGRVRDAIRMQRDIWNYHAKLDATTTTSAPGGPGRGSTRPTWYFWWRRGRSCGASWRSQPAIWWASVPVSAWASGRAALARPPARVFAGAGSSCCTFPGPLPAHAQLQHYLFEAIPYACLGLGLLLDRAWDGRHPSCEGLVLVVAGLFLLFLPS